MSHIFLLDRLKHTWDDNAVKLKAHIDEHKLDVDHLIHSMVVSSNSLTDLQHIAEQFFGTIVVNFRLYIIAPIQALFQHSAIDKLPSLNIMGRYAFTDSNSYGDGIVVANIDDGVYEKHPEFSDRYLGYWFGINSDTGVAEMRTRPGEWVSEHGTHTMGTLCGKTVGFAPNAKFTFLKLFNNSGADLMDMFKLVDLCLAKFKENPVAYPLPHVFNCSFGSDVPAGTDLNDPTFTAYASALQHMYDSVREYGSLFLFAAGNSGAAGNPIELPSFFNNSLSVGSIGIKDGQNFQLSSFSSFGTCLESNDAIDKISNSCPVMCGAGEDVLSSVPPNYSLTGYAKLSGTSMATPSICGVIASMYSFLIAKGLTRLQAYQRIRNHLCDDASYRKAPVGAADGYGRGLLQYSTFAIALLEGQ
jgi:subtilisin family serine protease